MKVTKGLSVIILLSASLNAYAQWTPTPNGQTSNSTQRREEQNRRDRDINPTSNPTNLGRNTKKTSTAVLPQITDEGRKIISVDPELKNKYGDFLKLPNTGLIKLFPNRCAPNKSGNNETVVAAGAGCFEPFIPGGGASFSFRTKSHTLKNLSDIELAGEKFNISGQLIQGLLVLLGDVPIESIKPEHDAMSFIAQFKPSSERPTAVKQSRELENGLRQGEFYYARSQPVKIDATYLLRSSAYRLEDTDPVSVFGHYSGQLFKADKRKDVIVAFRVISKAADGSVILLWREFSRKDSISLNM